MLYIINLHSKFICERKNFDCKKLYYDDILVSFSKTYDFYSPQTVSFSEVSLYHTIIS